MMRARVVAHYEALGWRVSKNGTVGIGAAAFRPELVMEKGGRRIAARISEDPVGTYEASLFGAQCRRARTPGVVVSLHSPELLEACEAAGLDFLDSETVGEPVVIPVARRASRPVSAPKPAPPTAAPSTPHNVPVSHPTAWRWGVVAMIWLVALLALVYWTLLVAG